jgi:hypothetical protein
VRGAPRQRARQLEKVEQQRLGQPLELKRAVVVLRVARARLPGRGEVGDALLLERRELVVELERDARLVTGCGAEEVFAFFHTMY